MSLPLKVAQCLNCPHVRFDEVNHQRFCETGNKISLQCELGCPHNLHHDPPICIPPPIELRGFFKPEIVAQRAAWRSIHLYPATLPDNFDRAEVMRWLSYLPVNLPTGCACRKNWPQLLAMIGDSDLSAKTALHRALVRIHNAKNRELGKAEISDARAARVYGITHLLPAEEIAADQSGPVRVLLVDRWGLGDAAMMTAAVRDLMAAYPGEFSVAVHGLHALLFDGLPGVVRPDDYRAWKPDIVVDWHRLEDFERHRHSIIYLSERLAVCINRPVPLGPIRPHLSLSDNEKRLEPPAIAGNGPYIVLACGHKWNLTTKAYPEALWQEVVDEVAAMRGTVVPGLSILRVGTLSRYDYQPKLSPHEAVIDLVDKTDLRTLMAYIAHPCCLGTLSGDTSIAHLAAGFGKPSVVVAGDRLPAVVVKYEGANWLQSHLPCAGCMLSRVVPLGKDYPWPEQDASLCTHPADQYASCMASISPDRVVAAVREMMHPIRDQQLSLYSPSQPQRLSDLA